MISRERLIGILNVELLYKDLKEPGKQSIIDTYDRLIQCQEIMITALKDIRSSETMDYTKLVAEEAIQEVEKINAS